MIKSSKKRKDNIKRDKQYYKFCLYGFLKNLRFFEPFLILFFVSKGLSFFEIGILYAIREISINIFEIPSGIFADTFGRRKTLAFSFLIYITAFIIFYFGYDFALFALGMIMYALGDAIRSGINKAMIIEYLKRTEQLQYKVNYYGHTRSWSQIGSALSSLIGGILVFYNQNLDAIFLFSIFPHLLDFFNVLSYPSYLDENIKQSDSPVESLKMTLIVFWDVLRKKEPLPLHILKSTSLQEIIPNMDKKLRLSDLIEHARSIPSIDLAEPEQVHKSKQVHKPKSKKTKKSKSCLVRDSLRKKPMKRFKMHVKILSHFIL